MGTILRVGFAMGGGVSLGTFNGAALTQALKLLLLRGVDREGRPYDRVEVDVFSGASAGSISLAIMLRGLVCPGGDRALAEARLQEEFGEEFAAVDDGAARRRDALITVQILQEIQEKIWIREISLKELLGQNGDDARKRIRFTAGLVDRGVVEELARKYLAFSGEDQGRANPGGWTSADHRSPGETGTGSPKIDLSRRQILADRVLFASSIANLTPIVADASGEYPADELGLLGLTDGMTSKVHRELRVFDLHFTDLFSRNVGERDKTLDVDELLNQDCFPRRWCRYHTGPKIRDTRGTGRGIGSLLESRGWAKVAATSIASGAFPLAFEPVPLERRSYEFGETEESDTSLWPKRLKGKDRHVFTYVDGGTFNNEPIREAFRLASFIDAQAPEEDFERLVVFVDPHVAVPDLNLRVPLHGEWMLEEPTRILRPLDGLDLTRKTSLDRLFPVARSLLGSLMNEARVVEADKVFRTRNRFRLRNEIRRQLAAALSSDPNLGVLNSLAQALDGLLDIDRVGVMIPAGALTLAGELRRVIAEEGREGGLLVRLRGKSPKEVEGFAADVMSAPASEPPTPPFPGDDALSHATVEERADWLRALTFVAVDRIMDLEGKMERSQLVAISPATDPEKPGELEELPGRLIGGFGGFTSELAGEHEVKVARYCAQRFLQSAGRIREEPLPERPDFSGQKEEYLRELKTGLGDLEERLIEVLADNHLDILGALPKGVIRLFIQGKLAAYAREEPKSAAYELRLEVPDMSFEFDGGGLADRDLRPRKIGDRFFLITFGTFIQNEGKRWAGKHVSAKNRTLKVDRDRRSLRPDKEFCTVQLPTKPLLKEAETLPYPVCIIRIKTTDEGRRVSSDRWELLDEVEGLEGRILG